MEIEVIDLDQLVLDMEAAATSVLQTDVSSLRGFSRRQMTAIAKQAGLIATGITTGQITEETQEYFLDNLEDMALSFAKTLRGLISVTIEKVWNAIVAVLWDAISRVTHITLPAPMINT